MEIHAVVIAGGKGERLRPYTDQIPKPMVMVSGKPILAYLISWLTQHHIRRITICCGHLHHVILDYFGDGSRFGAEIDYLIETEPLGRGGALRKALLHISGSTQEVLALNGDIITNLNIGELTSHHMKSSCIATIVSVPMISPYGIVEIEDTGLVQGFRSRPTLPYWINAGIYMLKQEIVNFFPEKGDHEITTFPLLARQGNLNAFQSTAFWRSIDTIQDLHGLQDAVDFLSLT
ncbi:MAG: nucleotidyltransferase family protein [Cyanobacteria bacterium]|nr:nucleotidyltransferase family protein [Cyanobacteriota bacterium]